MHNLDLTMLKNGARASICEESGQGSKILETQFSSFTKVNKSKQTKTWMELNSA